MIKKLTFTCKLKLGIFYIPTHRFDFINYNAHYLGKIQSNTFTCPTIHHTQTGAKIIVYPSKSRCFDRIFGQGSQIVTFLSLQNYKEFKGDNNCNHFHICLNHHSECFIFKQCLLLMLHSLLRQILKQTYNWKFREAV